MFPTFSDSAVFGSQWKGTKLYIFTIQTTNSQFRSFHACVVILASPHQEQCAFSFLKRSLAQDCVFCIRCFLSSTFTAAKQVLFYLGPISDFKWKKKCWISSCARHSCQTTWPLLGVVGWSQAWATELAKSITEAVQIQTRELFRISAQTFTGKPVGSVDAEGAPYKDCFGDLWLRGVKDYRNSTSTQAAGNTCTHSSKKPAQHCLR